jgi:hypothetical protein
MEKFYLKKADDLYGPFSVNDLKLMKITKSTPVRVENSSEWKKAQDIKALSVIFESKPGFGDQGIHWGDFQKDNCSGNGLRQYSAILWGIPWGQSWEQTCMATPATINGINFAHPARVSNTFVNIWGQFDVPDDSCGIVPPTPSALVTTECIAGINNNSLKRPDGMYDIEMQVVLNRIPHTYADPGNVVIAMIQSIDYYGNWSYVDVDPHVGLVTLNNTDHIEVAYGAGRLAQFHFRPTMYNSGIFKFRVWLKINGKETHFIQTGGIENGCIICSGKIL